MQMYAEDLIAAGTFLDGLIKLCASSKVDVSGDADGVALWFEGDIIGHVGMFDDSVSYTFRSAEPATK